MFIWGIVVAFLLSDMLGLLADVIGLPTGYWMIVFASPAFAFGAVSWWIVIERRESYTYFLGGAFGLLTALLTGLLWTAQFIRVWGVEMTRIPIIGFLIVFVLVVATIAGVLTALPLMYARRRLNRRRSDGSTHV
ncbi:MAG: hypothetical protein ABEJ27_00680 [Halodesulfurarchaeum sp.]